MEKQPKSLPNGHNDGEEWQKLLNTIQADDIPIELLKYLKAHMKDGTSFVFPVKEWLEQGSSLDDIEDIITRWYSAKDDDIAGSDFIVDIEKLKNTVQSQTDKLFKK